MICKKCGRDMPDGAPFCCWCGKRQQAAPKKTRRRARGTGSICKDPRNTRAPYIARSSPGIKGGHGLYLGSFATVKDAQAAIEQYEQGRYTELYNVEFCEAFEQWSAVHFDTLTDSGVQGYRAAYKSCADLHRRTFRDIKTADFQRVIDHHAADGASRSKLEKIRQLCSQLCKWAMQNDIIDKNYASFVKLPKDKKPEKSKPTFSPDEIAVLWSHADDTRARFVLLMIYTGLRIGEVAGIKPENVHLDGGYIIGGEKTDAGRDRVIPLPPNVPEIADFVRDWLAAPDGSPFGVHVNTLRQSWFYALLAELEMIAPPTYNPKTRKHEYKSPRLSPHCCRHTFASRAAASGMRPDDLQKIIGHADYSTTADIYVHQNLDTLKAAMSRIQK